MGAAFYIVLERDIPGFDPFVNGKFLVRAERSVRRIAEELNVTPLTNFFSQDAETVAELASYADLDATEFDIPDEQWFQAADGLKTVDALLEHLTINPESVRNSESVLSDLREYRAVLKRAAAEGVRWHVAFDF